MLLAGLLAKGRPQEYHAEDHADQTERIAYGACHGHVVCPLNIFGVGLQEGLLCCSEHRRVGYGTREKTHRISEGNS